MKGNCNYQPPAIIKYGETGTGQVLWNIERTDKTEDGKLIENWNFDYCEVNNFNRETIISGVIRSKYSQNEVEAITSNFLQGKDTQEFSDYQTFRQFAKYVADGKVLKTDIDTAMALVTTDDRIAELEDTAAAVVEVLNEKGITP